MIVWIVGIDRGGAQVLHGLSGVLAMGNKVGPFSGPSKLGDRKPRSQMTNGQLLVSWASK